MLVISPSDRDLKDAMQEAQVSAESHPLPPLATASFPPCSGHVTKPPALSRTLSGSIRLIAWDTKVSRGQ